MNKMCPTCPFLECNRGKETPTDFKCVEQNETDWYSEENVNRIWDRTRIEPIVFLSCHTTDHDYYGREGQPQYTCMGNTLMIYMHLRIFEDICNKGAKNPYKKYVNTVGGNVAMTQASMLEKAMAIRVGKTSLLWGGMIISKEYIFDIDKMRFPYGFKRTVAAFKKLNLLP